LFTIDYWAAQRFLFLLLTLILPAADMPASGKSGATFLNSTLVCPDFRMIFRGECASSDHGS
jgi:hypothetical protein